MPFRIRLPSAAIITGSAVSLIVLGASPTGCAADVRIGSLDPDAGGSPGSLVPPDASDASLEPRLCATAECPAGTTTCATSRTRCDVDLTSDRDNCGACGAACPPDQLRPPWGEMEPKLQVVFACVDSKCAMRCQGGFGDCDGVPDNGCETDLNTPTSCGGCGIACAPGVPCTNGQCGCPPPQVPCDGYCVDLRSDYSNCGACGHQCSDDDPAPFEHNLHVECIDSACSRTCSAPFADCNGDPSDGCEKNLGIPDDENCGECGGACSSGTTCNIYDDDAYRLRCSCAPGLDECPSGSRMLCRDLLTDPLNCGGCGVICSSKDSDSARPVCRGGLCGLTCEEGRADCNAFAADGCEIDLETDPQNCGACGNACDAEIGQPCVRGKCVEAECGGESR